MFYCTVRQSFVRTGALCDLALSRSHSLEIRQGQKHCAACVFRKSTQPYLAKEASAVWSASMDGVKRNLCAPPTRLCAVPPTSVKGVHVTGSPAEWLRTHGQSLELGEVRSRSR